MFTWINVSAGYDPFIESSTYVQVSNTEKLCKEVPGNNYDTGYLNDCKFRLDYGDRRFSKGDVARDKFYLFQAEAGGQLGQPVEMNMAYGGATEGNTNQKAIMGVSTHPMGLMTALDVEHMSICFPKNITQTSLVRFGTDSIIIGESTPLITTEPYKWAFKVDSISVEGFTAGTIAGGTFFFDTGASVSLLKSDIMDLFIKLVKENVDADPLIPYSGYELCYDASVRKMKLIISFGLDGGGSIDFQSDNIWENSSIDSCLAFKRAPANIDKNILGAKQMPGWTVGIDQVSAEIYFEINVDC